MIDALKFAFLGAFEARNGHWGLLTDLAYADLGGSKADRGTSPLAANPSGESHRQSATRHQVLDLDLAALRPEERRRRVTADLLFGARILDMSNGLRLELQWRRLQPRCPAGPAARRQQLGCHCRPEGPGLPRRRPALVRALLRRHRHRSIQVHLAGERRRGLPVRLGRHHCRWRYLDYDFKSSCHSSEPELQRSAGRRGLQVLTRARRGARQQPLRALQHRLVDHAAVELHRAARAARPRRRTRRAQASSAALGTSAAWIAATCFGWMHSLAPKPCARARAKSASSRASSSMSGVTPATGAGSPAAREASARRLAACVQAVGPPGRPPGRGRARSRWCRRPAALTPSAAASASALSDAARAFDQRQHRAAGQAARTRATASAVSALGSITPAPGPRRASPGRRRTRAWRRR